MNEKLRSASPRTYITVWATLMLLLLLTFGTAYVNLGPFNTVVALVIALVKALLIILFFMHVRYSSRLTWIFAGAGFIWLIIMLGLTMNDYLTRNLAGFPGW
ncbi:MAG: cytochrome C oxidase subunit IV family protein [Herpetosiphonaceae bacterium]|nr:cytochrome C oxidase subunit IV family protein [Herpetosiphonaceae bacterium]